jgi:hypothetical protein
MAVAVRSKNRKYCNSAGNYHFMDEEWLFCHKLPAHGRDIHRNNGYSAVNSQLKDKEYTRGIGFHL